MPVNAWLLITCDTAFYAIISIKSTEHMSNECKQDPHLLQTMINSVFIPNLNLGVTSDQMKFYLNTMKDNGYAMKTYFVPFIRALNIINIYQNMTLNKCI